MVKRTTGRSAEGLDVTTHRTAATADAAAPDPRQSRDECGPVVFARRSGQCLHQLQLRVANIAQALVLLLLETATQQLEHRRRRPWRQCLPLRLTLQDRGHCVREGRAFEGPLPGQHLEEHAAEGPHVSAMVDLLAPSLLGAHVGRRPHDRRPVAGGRGPGGSLRVDRGFPDGLGQTEVEELHPAVKTDTDVPGLEVAVQHALLVRRLQGQRDLLGDRERLAKWHGPSAKTIREALAFHELYDEDGQAVVGFLETVEGGDAGVVEGGEDAGLLPQAGEALGLEGELVGKRLEGDLAVQLRIAGAVDLAHASGSEPGDDLVGAHARSRSEHDGPPE